MTLMYSLNLGSEEALVASGGTEARFPVRPPSSWFLKAKNDKPYPIEFDSDGRVHGYCVDWKAEHVGFGNAVVKAPHSKCNYAYFMNKKVECDDGKILPVGVITSNAVHPKVRGLSAEDAQKFYDNVGMGVADVAVYEDEHGIQVAGALRPNVTDADLRVLRGSDFSPDWRHVNVDVVPENRLGSRLSQMAAPQRHREMVALMACNLSGFITPGETAALEEALVASGACVDLVEYAEPGNICVAFDDQGEVDYMFGPLWGFSTHYKEQDELTKLQSRIERLEALLADQIEAQASQAISELFDYFEDDESNEEDCSEDDSQLDSPQDEE